MKIITDHRSPNFNARPARTVIDCIVIHTTESTTVTSAINTTMNPANKVAYHDLIDANRAIYAMVDPSKRAWHAGTSELHGQKDVNSFSIGIALVGQASGSFLLAEIEVLVERVAHYCAQYPIPLNRIIGHQHVAPTRRGDPGPNFPWRDFLLEVAFRLGVAGNPLHRA